MEYWQWLVLGSALIIFEMIAVTFLLIWFGFSALIVGILVYIEPNLPWEAQAVMFPLLALCCVFAWKIWGSKRFTSDKIPLLNQRAHRFIGRKFILHQPIVENYGRVSIRDTSWAAQADEDYPAGTEIEVYGVDGATLLIRKVE